MLKAIGFALILICSSALGLSAAQKLTRRTRQLEEAIRLTELLASDMRYTLSPMEDLIGRAGRFADLPFLEDCARYCREGAAYPTAWKKALDGSRMSLTPEDKRELYRLGPALGSTDLEGSLGELQHTRLMLEQRHREALERQEKLAGLYQTMGVLGGLSLIILLF